MLAGHQGILPEVSQDWPVKIADAALTGLTGSSCQAVVVSPFLCLDHFGSSCSSFWVLFHTPILSPISIYFRYFSLFFQLSSLRYNISTVLPAFVPPWPQVSFPPGLGDVETGKSARNFGDGSGVRFRDKSTFDTSPKFCIDELL